MSKFFALDLHIGIRDIQFNFNKLGHSLDIWSISDHHSIMGWERPRVDIVNQYTWRNLNPDMCNSFYERYKNELQKYDGFVCFYPPTFALLYEKFDKPILVYVPLRYETPFHDDPVRWKWFNDFLEKGIKTKKIIPVVNNIFDKKYISHFTDFDFQLIPSLGEYTGASYTGKINEFVYNSKFSTFKNYIKIPNIIDKNQVYDKSWQAMADYKAIVHIPYSNTSMTLFEQYNSNIPLLFPSKEFLIQLWKQHKDNGIMSEISWRQIFRLNPGSVISCKLPDPNDYRNLESFEYWSSFSDFYDENNMPYIECFDSISELEYKLFTLNFKEISAKMNKFNLVKKDKILKQWEKILENI